MNSEEMKIAIVTGNHGFEEDEFDEVFESMDGIEFVREELSDFVEDSERNKYDSVVFYNFHQENPNSETAQAILSLADRGKGLVILHHAILAFPNWKEFSDISGIDDYEFDFYNDVEIRVHVADSSHPITSGIDDWTMIDETYTLQSPREDSHVLLTVDNPKSMKVIGWTRTYRNSRVFCLQSGHGPLTYSVQQFREILERGIRWSAKKLFS